MYILNKGYLLKSEFLEACEFVVVVMTIRAKSRRRHGPRHHRCIWWLPYTVFLPRAKQSTCVYSPLRQQEHRHSPRIAHAAVDAISSVQASSSSFLCAIGDDWLAHWITDGTDFRHSCASSPRVSAPLQQRTPAGAFEQRQRCRAHPHSLRRDEIQSWGVGI